MMPHRVQGNTSVSWFITKVVIKDTDEQLDEGCRTGSWRVFGTALAPLGQSVLPFRQECVHQPVCFLNLLCNLRVVGALSCRHSSFSCVNIYSPAFSPPLGVKVRAESFKLLIMAWSFLWPSPVPNLYRDPQSPHIFLAYKRHITLEIPRVLEDLLSGTEFKSPNMRTWDEFSTPITQ